MISSEMPEILGMSDRIMVMHEGHVSGFLDRSEATQEKIMALAALEPTSVARRARAANDRSLPRHGRLHSGKDLPVMANTTAVASVAPGTATRRWALPTEASILLVLVGIALLFEMLGWALRGQSFLLNPQRLMIIILQVSIIGLLAIGVTQVIITAASTCPWARSWRWPPWSRPAWRNPAATPARSTPRSATCRPSSRSSPGSRWAPWRG